MLIRWVNHASFIVETAQAKLICDPWIEGPAFNNGWRHLSPTKFSYSDFAHITHIWFSHEHPDHFSPPNLQKIPEEFRRRITVLFHWTKDKRVLNLCKDLGFIACEMAESRPLAVADMQLICGRNEAIDSWLGIHHDGCNLLNMNDCVYPSARDLVRIRELVGPPDVLFTQFSYASWVGNRGDVTMHRRAAKDKLEELRRQAETFQPKWIVPFASFVWFSHEENYYMNETMNRVSDVVSYCNQALKAKPALLYPGDTWEVGALPPSEAALERYEADYARVFANPALDRGKSASDEELLAAAAKFVAQLRAKNNRFLLRLLPAATVYLTDKNQTATIHSSGLRLASGRLGAPDVELSSDSLLYCFRFGWGGDSLQVNGRYQVPPEGNPQRFFQYVRVASLNTGEEFLDSKMVAKRLAGRAARWLSRSYSTTFSKAITKQAV